MPRALVGSNATPPDTANGPPALVPSITNWTVPPGVLGEPMTGATEAPRTTVSPTVDGFFVDTTVTDVAGRLLTVWPPERAPVLVAKLVLPL